MHDAKNSAPPNRLKLLQETYDEVLDATKHQDDKIGRLLTAISFLTAASLALAGLDSASLIQAKFEIGDRSVQLGVLALSGYLMAVFVAVVLLVTSFATPLRLPGLRSNYKRSTDYVPWANAVPGSQIYFGEISRLPLEDWQRKWDASEVELIEEKTRSLVLETHNLSVRTNFKYLRTSEAIAFFSIAMLSLALAVAAVALAAIIGTTPPDSEGITVPQGREFRVTVGLVISGYLFVQLISRFRYDHQSIYEGYRVGTGARTLVFFVSRLVFVCVVPLMVWLTITTPPEVAAPHRTMAAVTLVSVLVLPVTLAWTPNEPYPFSWRTRVRILVYFTAATAATQVVTNSLNSTSYDQQFVVGVALTSGLLALSITQAAMDDFLRRVIPGSIVDTRPGALLVRIWRRTIRHNASGYALPPK